MFCGLALAAALAPGLAPAPLAQEPQELPVWEIDSAHSAVEFSIRHFLTAVPGRFNQFDGTITFDPEHLDRSEVSFTVQAASIDTRNADRDRHLRSPDFFDAEKFPTLRFESSSFTRANSELRVTGELTIHGVTQEVTVPVEFLGRLDTPRGSKAGFAANFTINRKDFDITWNRNLDQGGAVLGEEVEIRVNIEANMQQPPGEKPAE
jgi:polyisoprenoid-binding protein YceI